jgi:ABC-type nickel/cobalt efflux system permease component RcnA
MLGAVGDGLSEANNWNAWVSLGTALTCFAFVAAYAVLARWWRTYEGKVMMGKAVAIGLLALYTFVAVEYAPDSEALRWARVAMVAAIGVFMIFQTARLISNQVGRRDPNRRK